MRWDGFTWYKDPQSGQGKRGGGSVGGTGEKKWVGLLKDELISGGNDVVVPCQTTFRLPTRVWELTSSSHRWLNNPPP